MLILHMQIPMPTYSKKRLPPLWLGKRRSRSIFGLRSVKHLMIWHRLILRTAATADPKAQADYSCKACGRSYLKPINP